MLRFAVVAIVWLQFAGVASGRSVWLSSSTGHSGVIREYDVDSGEELSSFTVPVSSIDGLSYDQRGHLWALTEGRGRVLQYSRSGTLLRDVTLNGLPRSLEGLACIGENLLIASPGAKLYIEVDTSGQILRTVPMDTAWGYSGIAAGGGQVFAAGDTRLAVLDAATLTASSVRPFPTFGSTGLAFDGQFLWTNYRDTIKAFDAHSLSEVHAFSVPNEFHEGMAVEFIPEPSTIALLTMGAFGVLAYGRRRRDVR